MLAAGLPPSRVLTPYPSDPLNTFIGIRVPPAPNGTARPPRGRQGVVWGKEAEYYEGRLTMLGAVLALNVTLASRRGSSPSRPCWPSPVQPAGKRIPLCPGAPSLIQNPPR